MPHNARPLRTIGSSDVRSQLFAQVARSLKLEHHSFANAESSPSQTRRSCGVEPPVSDPGRVPRSRFAKLQAGDGAALSLALRAIFFSLVMGSLFPTSATACIVARDFDLLKNVELADSIFRGEIVGYRTKLIDGRGAAKIKVAEIKFTVVEMLKGVSTFEQTLLWRNSTFEIPELWRDPTSVIVGSSKSEEIVQIPCAPAFIIPDTDQQRTKLDLLLKRTSK